ncbi:hypothetical protein [Jiangella asiatica]|uniref:Alpha-L-arabinofuranosidase 1 catalytic domain-containing protein n=1 Tax=Jiangella asiatica TaxID=2530372 RepID=A0A4R5CIW0_9ACTN|nr:hypothetical protein [Jiangella asiatica]TDE00199.1 hypothetical protein E1269_26160 [Jiangella asiatica]
MLFVATQPPPLGLEESMNNLGRKLARTSPLGVMVVTLSVCAQGALAGDPAPLTATIAVDAGKPTKPVNVTLMGANHRYSFDGYGMWHVPGGGGTPFPDPIVVEGTDRAGVKLVRYPGGTLANLFEWKRAIGPLEDRSCQVDSRRANRSPLESNYGPDEHEEYVEASSLDPDTGQPRANPVESQIMVPFHRGTPEDAADWVEYMNAPVGTNPNGGTAWADVRAENGHADPHDVTYWEVGNEPDRPNQRYWMSEDDAAAMDEYILGGTTQQVDQLVGTRCDHRSSAAASDGSAHQTFTVHYPPVVPDSETIQVGQSGDPDSWVTWTGVADLATAGPDDQVYEFDPASGTILFGDGTNGQIPPQGRDIRATYGSGPHAGYPAYYAAMKAVDPDIEVCAAWGTAEFVARMEALGHESDYDCLSVHPYVNFGRDFGTQAWESARQAHDQHMVGELASRDAVIALNGAIRDGTTRTDVGIALSEYGAIGGPPPTDPQFPQWTASMTHALYMASQMLRFHNLGVEIVEGGALTDTTLRGVFGAAPDFVYSAEAAVRQAIRPLALGGGDVVPHSTTGNPTITSADGSYQALVVGTSVRNDGALVIAVVNRHPTQPVEGTVTYQGFTGSGSYQAREVAPGSFTAFNTAQQPEAVALSVTSESNGGSGSLTYRFAPHSVTVLLVDPQ